MIKGYCRIYTWFMRKQTRCIWRVASMLSWIFYSNRASDNILKFLSLPCHRTVTVIFDRYDHFSTVTIIFGQLRSYPVDSYNHVADVWFVSYDHITQVSQAHISKRNAQTNKAWHAKPRPTTPLYCVQIREHNVAYKRHNRPCPNSPSPTSAILYDRNCYDHNCFSTVLMVNCLMRGATPIAFKNFTVDCPTKPRQPTSTGYTWHFQPLSSI